MNRSNIGRMLAMTGAILQLSLIPGILLFFVSATDAFHELASSENNGDAVVLSAEISEALHPLGISVVVCLIGFALMLAALWILHYQKTWFFGALLVATFPVMISYIPLGTVVGIGFVVYFIVIRDRFLQKSSQQVAAGNGG